MIPEPEECVDGVCQMREESEEVAQDEAGDNKAGADEHNITNVPKSPQEKGHREY
jgi:hypothetical protein